MIRILSRLLDFYVQIAYIVHLIVHRLLFSLAVHDNNKGPWLYWSIHKAMTWLTAVTCFRCFIFHGVDLLWPSIFCFSWHATDIYLNILIQNCICLYLNVSHFYQVKLISLHLLPIVTWKLWCNQTTTKSKSVVWHQGVVLFWFSR